ncbi:MAG TPA: DinB family protein [Longimicrobiales bacterium]|nr:DinB family protein [Longimicrobiales bacterium]
MSATGAGEGHISVRMQRPEAGEYHPFYAGYVARVPPGDILTILRDQIIDTRELLRRVSTAGADYAYAPGKWSVKEVVGHVADAERVFGYRALRFARGDDTPLSGFDETRYVPAGRFAERPLGQLVEELAAVRGATLALLNGLPDEAWSRSGLANGTPVTVRAIATIIAGHELHHRAILETRYLPGAAAPVR